VKLRVTHLLQSMEVPARVYPGEPRCTDSLQKGHTESSNRQESLNTPIQTLKEAQLPPGTSHAELKEHMTGVRRTDLIEEMTPLKS